MHLSGQHHASQVSCGLPEPACRDNKRRLQSTGVPRVYRYGQLLTTGNSLQFSSLLQISMSAMEPRLWRSLVCVGIAHKCGCGSCNLQSRSSCGYLGHGLLGKWLRLQRLLVWGATAFKA